MLAPHARSQPHHHAAVITLAALYAGFIGWTYVAWYRRPWRDFRWGGDGTWKLWQHDSWFGTKQYAGGADKMGHAWATSALARAGTEMLSQWGHYGRLKSALIGTAASEALFFGVEVTDGFTYRFSYGDFTFNTLGALFAFAQSMSPTFDRLVDLRVDERPSQAFRDQVVDNGDVDIAEDYSGQTYHLAFHLGGIPPLRAAKWGAWSQFVDVTLGFETRGYKPDPLYTISPTMPDFPKRQTMFAGVSLNVQGLGDYLLHRRAPTAAKVVHAITEVFSIPYTVVRAVDTTRRPGGTVPDDQ